MSAGAKRRAIRRCTHRVVPLALSGLLVACGGETPTYIDNADRPTRALEETPDGPELPDEYGYAADSATADAVFRVEEYARRYLLDTYTEVGPAGRQVVVYRKRSPTPERTLKRDDALKDRFPDTSILIVDAEQSWRDQQVLSELIMADQEYWRRQGLDIGCVTMGRTVSACLKEHSRVSGAAAEQKLSHKYNIKRVGADCGGQKPLMPEATRE